MKKYTEHLFNALKGFAMGAANVVPGVSGGTIALITNIYKRLIDSLNSLMSVTIWKELFSGHFSEFWKKIDGKFLLALCAGIVLSIFTLAKLMTYVLENCPVETWAFFFGLIIASSILMFNGIQGWGIKELLLAVLGIALGLTVCTLSPTETPDSWWFIAICGAIGVCTMILPGISGSFILVILGKYDFIMNAIAELNLPVLAIFAVGCSAGILAFSKFLHWLLARFEKQTMLVLLGFVLGSLVKVWPWANVPGNGFPHLTGAIICCIAGVALVLGIELYSKKHSN